MTYWKKLLVAAFAALTLASCAPVAQVIVDAIDSSDGASLTYVTQGLEFDPGPAPALGVIVKADGFGLALLDVPEGIECSITSEVLDCRLGDVTAPVTIGLTGEDVLANATWRRAGSNTVYMTFARVATE